jgi:hypothetical protein
MGNSAKQMGGLKSPVAYFLGGAKDIAQKNVISSMIYISHTIQHRS